MKWVALVLFVANLLLLVGAGFRVLTVTPADMQKERVRLGVATAEGASARGDTAARGRAAADEEAAEDEAEGEDAEARQFGDREYYDVDVDDLDAGADQQRKQEGLDDAKARIRLLPGGGG